MDISLKILRYDPESDRKGHWENYIVDAEPEERILDLLHKIKWFEDGSPFKNIELSKKRNQHILFDIDWKGARKIRKKYNIDEIIDFFILPPSKTELRKRLIKRGRDNSKDISLRLSYAFKEMQHYKEYKYILINESVNKTVNEIKKIIEFEEENLNNKKLLAKNLKRIINF